MNERTFPRIIQFAVQSDANSYQTLADRILSSIDEYFDLVLSTTYRTEEQWEQLRNEALEWAERFFDKIKSTLPLIVDTIHQNILNLFDKQKESIAERAGYFTRTDNQLGFSLPSTSKRVCDFVRMAVHEEVMKVAASEAMKASLSTIDKIVNDDLLNKKKRNELLSMARRHIEFWEVSGEDLKRRTFFAAILEHLIKTPTRIGRFFTYLRTRPFLDWYDQHTNEFEFLAALDNYASLFNESKRLEYARKLLVKMRQNIVEEKPLFGKNLLEWIQTKQSEFIKRIDQGHQYAIDTMEQRKKVNELTQKYTQKFAILECKLIAAKDLAKFNGIKPIIFEEELLGSGGFFNVYAAQWGDKQNLAVKRQLPAMLYDYPEASYMEAHYHRAITNAHQMNVVPLLYLYHDNKELYIFMPKYQRSLQKYLQENIQTIKFDKILSFSLIIANVLNGIHQNDLVHRDIKSSNILLDHDDQCYLNDFGTAKEGTWTNTFVGTLPLPQEMIASAILQQFSLPTVYSGKAVDIYAYGILLYELLPKKEYHRPTMDTAKDVEKLVENNKIYPLSNELKDYKQLIIDCLQINPNNRPTASMIITRLETLMTLSETKPCVICLDNPRTIRTLPCGHKVLCQQCRHDLRMRNRNLCVICKRLMQTDTQDEFNQTFYMKK
jgi:serine/threonine-protein kinase RIO1